MTTIESIMSLISNNMPRMFARGIGDCVVEREGDHCVHCIPSFDPLNNLILKTQHGTLLSTFILLVGPLVPATCSKITLACGAAQYVLWDSSTSTTLG